MKRTLSLLLALIAVALAATASVPKLSFSDSEIHLSAGQSQEVYVMLDYLDENVTALQMQFTMYDSNHKRIDGPVRLEKCYTDDWGNGIWFQPVGISTADYHAGNECSVGPGLTPEMSVGDYRLAGINFPTDYTNWYYWSPGDVTEPTPVFVFTVTADEGWNDDKATLELDLDFTMFVTPSGAEYYIDEPLVLTIVNTGEKQTQTATPVITTEQTDDAVIVSAVGDGVVKLYREDVEVENPYNEPRTSEAHTVTFYATAQETGCLVSDVAMVTIFVPAREEQTQTATPVITTEQTDDAVIVSAVGDGVVKLYREDVEVENPYNEPRTSEAHTVTFYATAQETGSLVSDAAMVTIFVPAREEQPVGDGISIYVKADEAPYLYSWNGNGDQCGVWPGTLLSETVTINREEYYMYHFDLNMVNVIFNNGYGQQTGDFTNITQDAYFIYDGNDLAYGLIPPEVYGNLEGEYAFFVNTDGWSQVNAVVNGNSYPMTKVGVDGAGFEIYKWEVPSLSYTPTVITFDDGNGHGVVDAYGNIYTSNYVKGGYYVYSFFQSYYQVRLDMVTIILFDDASQRPVLEDCALTLLSSNQQWNSYQDVEFRIQGTYFSRQARQGLVCYSVDGGEWTAFTASLNSEQQFDQVVSLDFDRTVAVHSIRLAARDISGAYSSPITMLQAVDVSALTCTNIPEAEYTGQDITFDPVIVDMSGEVLSPGDDYTFTFSNNVNVGTAYLAIEAVYPRCIGHTSIEFTILPHLISGDVDFVDGITQYYVTGSPITPQVVVVDDTFGTLTMGTDYLVTYSDNVEVGQALAVVTGIGSFTGTIELPFEILAIPYGDVNYSGDINIADLQAMIKYIFGEYDKPFFFAAADLNIDNTVNIQDVVGEAALLMSMDLTMPATPMLRAPQMEYSTQEATLFWHDGTLYLYTPVPVAALDIVNADDGDITWNVPAMKASTTMTRQGQHTVIYSLSDAVIGPGLTTLATTTGATPAIVAARLSSPDAELIGVRVGEPATGITDITRDSETRCRVADGQLIITSGTALTDVNVTVYSVDGRVLAHRQLSWLDAGSTSIDLSDMLDGHRYGIIVVRNARQVLGTVKTTQIR